MSRPAEQAPGIEESGRFTPAFDADGLIPCVTIDAANGDVLMVAWMNAEALRLTLESYLGARGVAVMLEAEHMCMSMRGVQKSGASTMTSRFTGVFKEDPSEQIRFMTLVGGGRR